MGQARTFALVAWFIGHVALGLATAERRSALSDVIRNPALLLWAAGAILFAAGLVLVPPLRGLIGTSAIPPAEAAFCAGFAFLIPLWLAFVPGPTPARVRKAAR